MPSSRRPPLPKTQIFDADRIVDNRCAITSVVHDDAATSLSRAAWTTCSDFASSADVASSSINKRGFPDNCASNGDALLLTTRELYAAAADLRVEALGQGVDELQRVRE